MGVRAIAGGSEREGHMKRFFGLLVAVVVLTAAFVGAAGTASAASKATYYLSLGDSLAGGAAKQYPDQLFNAVRDDYKQLRLVKMGCGGETALGMIVGDVGCAPGIYEHGSQLNQAVAFLQAHPGEVAFITIDIGANDILGLYGCADFETFVIDGACVDANLPTVEGNMATILHALHGAAPGVPVVGMTYYDVFLGTWYLGAPSVALADHPVVKELNEGFAATYEANATIVADVWAAFDSDDFEVIDTEDWGGVPTNVAHICDWTAFCLTLDIHPNMTGYGVIAEAFEDVLP
jgi:lysophospholipase L1-like esterase